MVGTETDMPSTRTTSFEPSRMRIGSGSPAPWPRARAARPRRGARPAPGARPWHLTSSRTPGSLNLQPDRRTFRLRVETLRDGRPGRSGRRATRGSRSARAATEDEEAVLRAFFRDGR